MILQVKKQPHYVIMLVSPVSSERNTERVKDYGIYGESSAEGQDFATI